MSDAVRSTPTIDEIRQRLQSSKGKEYWQGLDELADTDEFRAFLAEEFLARPLRSRRPCVAATS